MSNFQLLYLNYDAADPTCPRCSNQLDPDVYQCDQHDLIGRGSFGSVWKGVLKDHFASGNLPSVVGKFV
jgi:hypothetical protein